MHFKSRGFASPGLLFWLAVNVAVVAIVAYEVATFNRPPRPRISREELELLQAVWARSPQIGQPAPEFSLPLSDGSGAVSLSSFRGKKPVVLIFGSYTCPVFRGHTSALNDVYARYQDRAEFLLVYVREAHPAEDGHISDNETVGRIAAPKDLEERSELAELCAACLGIEMPLLVDDMENSTAQKYDAWPERLYVVGTDGNVVYSGSGPGDVNVPAMTAALEAALR